MPTFSALEQKKAQLIRKATKGGVFVAPVSADPVAELTELVSGKVLLKTLPTGYEDLGYLTGDGAQFAREVATSDISSWGATTPTRTDITSDSTTLTVLAQETKLVTIGLSTGADVAGITAAADTGEVSIEKGDTTAMAQYRVLSVALDKNKATGGEIYIARFLPRAEVSNYAEQSFGSGDEAIGWGVTFSSKKDDALNYSERWIFGGQGWLDLLDEMGIEQETVTP